MTVLVIRDDLRLSITLMLFLFSNDGGGSRSGNYCDSPHTCILQVMVTEPAWLELVREDQSSHDLFGHSQMYHLVKEHFSVYG